MKVRIASGIEEVAGCQHVKVFGEPEVFAGWPFNNGLEQYGDGSELVVNFVRYRCQVRQRPDGSNAYWSGMHPDSGRRRSLDGGQTWQVEGHLPWDRGKIGSTVATSGELLEDSWKHGIVDTLPIDPANGDHGLFTGSGRVGGVDRSFVCTTHDRGKSWNGPSFLPQNGVDFSHNRPSWLVRPDGAFLTFPTTAQKTGREGQVFTYISLDRGVTWAFLSVMAASDSYALIMPAAVNLPSGRILAAVRVHHYPEGLWTELYDSNDGGRTWGFAGRLNDHGAPCDLMVLPDGRLLAIYGCRRPPFGIRARISEDVEGWRWGPELILRGDGASEDLGYPRGAVLPDGSVCTTYYFHEREYPKPADCDQFHWGTRSIFATIFKP